MSAAVKDRFPGETLLVVDDDEQVRGMLMEGLQIDGMRMLEARNGREAVTLAELHKPHAILLDIGLPDSSGLDLIQEILGKVPGCMIIMLTGRADEESVVEAMLRGALDYLSKPFKMSEVRAMVESALARSRRNRAADDAPTPGQVACPAEGSIVGKSACMMEVFKLIGRLSVSDVPVLISGESGTGKELVAKALHRYSSHAGGPFVTVDCAGIPESLFEAELFGYERGAFTGSVNAKPGRLEITAGGTLFIDEVGNIPLSIQSKLLRSLQEKTTQRLGSNMAIKWDARILAATNADLKRLVANGKFREDLFFRLSGGEITVPPLRDRAEDIILLTVHFLAGLGAMGAGARLSDETVAALKAYPWPGNVRELEHAISHAAALARGGVISVEDLPEKVRTGAERPEAGGPGEARGGLSMDEMKRAHVKKTLAECGGNKAVAARKLGIDRKTLNSLLREAGGPPEEE